MKKFDIGDYVSFEDERGRRVCGTVTHLWRSRRSVNIRVSGSSNKVEIPVHEVSKVI